MKERGCGMRIKGGIYAEVRQSPDGMPVEYFLIDPPLPMDTQALGIRPIGVSVIERGGMWHVFDQVGEDGYPNVADFVEETRLMGASRRLSRSMDFTKLRPGSRIILLHKRAFIANFEDYYRATVCNCPKHVHVTDGDEPPTEMCAGLWWQDITEGLVLIEAGKAPDYEARVRERVMPSLTYHGNVRPEAVTPHYQIAAFMSLPIGNIAVIRDPDGGTHEQALEAARHAGFPVVLEDA